MGRRLLIAGNWKMNGLRAELAELDAIAAAVASQDTGPGELLVAPPATLLAAAREHLPSDVSVAAQTCHHNTRGPHTGDLSAHMLQEAGADSVILGHSERRTDHRESDEDVCARAQAALAAGLRTIVCVGESEAERRANETLTILGRQLDGSVPGEVTAEKLVIAYEPIWAIGTGLTPTPHDIAELHAFLRNRLALRFGHAFASCVRILYGGSVKPSNAAEFFALDDVDGALIGGASLKATDFLAIARSAPER
ncbi:triose-phosphate isomerase [Aureimonas jatrophae]|uniref:Triosephosphate isomerase n=1 Tax=Aureimonas jatrophae TaxID=1166073 RepID=A0A1H0GX73_9HYPH|nr:triose-phosphate isomerase [Aureimonas jatrophae]MBB3949852.1 triosephosphate isomerase [Aureimonas jatrophae]SDO11646.1 triosephosphate isomerase [Aureimonas jatrophae]